MGGSELLSYYSAILTVPPLSLFNSKILSGAGAGLPVVWLLGVGGNYLFSIGLLFIKTFIFPHFCV